MSFRLLVVLALLAVGALTGASARAESDPAKLRERAMKLMGEGTQTSLPGGKPVAAGTTSSGKSSSSSVGAAGSALGGALFYVLAGVAALLVVAFFARELLSGEKTAELAVAPVGETAADRAALVARPLDDAELLASQGQFGQAIHTLLLRTLEELVRRADQPLLPSLTSREILASVGLHPAPRAALSHLVSAVEVSFFGGSEPSESDYQACRERFHAFAAAFRGAA